MSTVPTTLRRLVHSTADARPTPSSACFAGSKTSGASTRRPTSSPPSASPRQSATGTNLGPKVYCAPCRLCATQQIGVRQHSVEPNMKLIWTISGVAFLILISPAHAAGRQLAYPACKDRSLMSRALELSDESDFQAVEVIFRRGIKSKECGFIPADQLVIETNPPFPRLIKVHKRGDPDEFWIMH